MKNRYDNYFKKIIKIFGNFDIIATAGLSFFDRNSNPKK